MLEINLTANNLNKIFDCCKNFVEKGGIRPIYECVHLECKNGICNAYATDGYKDTELINYCPNCGAKMDKE